MRLYLHPDLCKAEVTKVAPGRARGVPKPEMRVRATTHKKTAGEQRRVGREERAYAGTAENKPPYRCRECGTHVKPPKKQVIDRRLSVKEELDHEAAGREVHPGGGPHGHTVVIHPPEIFRGSKRHVLTHGSVTAEMLPTKTQSGRRLGGVCPSCHTGGKPKIVARATGTTPEASRAALHAHPHGPGVQGMGTATGTKKSIDLLNSMLDFGKPMARREGESSNEFMSRTIRHLVNDKGYDQKRAVAAAYRMTGHPKAGKPVKKSISLYLAV